MKTTQITLIAIIAIIIAACSTSKKGTTSSASSTPAKSETGIYAPGNEELTAIQAQYKDVTLDKLKEGHTIFTEGACTKCHGSKSIYKRDVAEWKGIVDRMAVKAKITDEQKDAVYKYVLAIKATQPK